MTKKPLHSCPMKDIANIFAGFPIRGKIQEDEDGNALVVQVKDLQINQTLDWSKMRKTTITLTDRRKPGLLKLDDILFLGRGSNFFAVHINEPLPLNLKVVASPHLFVIRVKENPKFPILPSFLTWQINYGPLKTLFHENAFGAVQKSIRRKVLDDAPVIVPPLAVQEKYMDMVQSLVRQQQLLLSAQNISENMLTAAAFFLRQKSSLPDNDKNGKFQQSVPYENMETENYCHPDIIHHEDDVIDLAKLFVKPASDEEAGLYLLDIIFVKYKELLENQKDEYAETWNAAGDYDSTTFQTLKETVEKQSSQGEKIKDSIMYHPKTDCLYTDGRKPFELKGLTLEKLLDKISLETEDHAKGVAWQLSNGIVQGKSAMQPHLFGEFAQLIASFMKPQPKEKISIYDPQCQNGCFLSFLGSFFGSVPSSESESPAANAVEIPERVMGQEADARLFQQAIRAAFLRKETTLCMKNENAWLHPLLEDENRFCQFDLIASLSLNIFNPNGVPAEYLTPNPYNLSPAKTKGTANPFGLFYQLLASLKEEGILALLIPNALLFQERYQQDRKTLLSHNVLKMLIDLSPHGSFLLPGSPISPFSIMVCQKESNQPPEDIIFFDGWPPLSKERITGYRISREEIAKNEYTLIPRPYIKQNTEKAPQKEPLTLLKEQQEILNTISVLEKDLGNLLSIDLS